MENERTFRRDPELLTEGILRIADGVQKDLAIRNYGFACRGLTILNVIGVRDHLAREFAISRLTQIEEILRLHRNHQGASEDFQLYIDGLITQFCKPVAYEQLHEKGGITDG